MGNNGRRMWYYTIESIHSYTTYKTERFVSTLRLLQNYNYVCDVFFCRNKLLYDICVHRLSVPMFYFHNAHFSESTEGKSPVLKLYFPQASLLTEDELFKCFFLPRSILQWKRVTSLHVLSHQEERSPLLQMLPSVKNATSHAS